MQLVLAGLMDVASGGHWFACAMMTASLHAPPPTIATAYSDVGEMPKAAHVGS